VDAVTRLPGPPPATKATVGTGPGKQPVRDFRDLIDHLATLTRGTIVGGGQIVGRMNRTKPT
jgi:hypothetical protein